MRFAFLNLDAAAFFVRNVSAARNAVDIKSEDAGDLLFRGYSSLDEKAISEIYKKLNNGNRFSMLQRKLYSRIGRCFMFVVEQKRLVGQAKIVGMNMYYLNKKDFQENTIHEGFIGVMPEVGGQGIATKMRKMAGVHFGSMGFAGISTRISLNNHASLCSARKIGFEPVEQYYDTQNHEYRYYMICSLQRTSE